MSKCTCHVVCSLKQGLLDKKHDQRCIWYLCAAQTELVQAMLVSHRYSCFLGFTMMSAVLQLVAVASTWQAWVEGCTQEQLLHFTSAISSCMHCQAQPAQNRPMAYLASCCPNKAVQTGQQHSQSAHSRLHVGNPLPAKFVSDVHRACSQLMRDQ